MFCIQVMRVTAIYRVEFALTPMCAPWLYAGNRRCACLRVWPGRCFAKAAGWAECRDAQRLPACVTLGFMRQPNQPRVVADKLFADDPRTL